MVDFADLNKVNSLWWEVHNIESALGNFDAGGIITAMTISGSDPTQPPMGVPGMPPIMPRPAVTVSALGMPYPAGMIDAIKNSLREKLQAINDELSSLGVTGTEAPRSTAAPSPSPAAASSPPSPPSPPQPQPQPARR